MLLYDKTPATQQSSKAPSATRLEELAAIWSSQTGRAIVVSVSPPAVRGS
jgi:hypothetical protein